MTVAKARGDAEGELEVMRPRSTVAAVRLATNPQRAAPPLRHPGPPDTALFADYKEGAGNPDKLVEAFIRSIPLGRNRPAPGATCSSPAMTRPLSPDRC